MLLGMINKGYEQIHIKENNGKISFIKVDDKVSYLKKEEAINVLNEIFSTNDLRYLESNNGYDIYLDLADNKRYFKNGIEDFNMFYDNNGKSAIRYSNGKKNDSQKIFKIVTTIGIYATIFFSSKTITELIQKYVVQHKIIDKQVIIDDLEESFPEIIDSIEDSEYPYYAVDSAFDIEQYINDTTGMSDYEKNCIRNEDYFEFLVNITSDSGKKYELPERLLDINTSYYTDDTNESQDDNAIGYYSPGTNIINIKEEIKDDKTKYKDTLDHEFVHLTQIGYGYCYIDEALAEILSNEFYGDEIHSYLNIVKNVKLLTEAIGPDAVLSASFNFDQTKFENSIKEYLDEEDSKELLKLLDDSDIYTDKEKEISDKVYTLIGKLINRKYSNNPDERDAILLACTNQNRIYFNNNKEEYYNSLNFDYSKKFMIEYPSVLEYIHERKDIKYLDISQLHFSFEQFKENLEDIKRIYLEQEEIKPIIIRAELDYKPESDSIDEDTYDEDLSQQIRETAGGMAGGMKDPTFELELFMDEDGNFIVNGKKFDVELFIDTVTELWDEKGVSETTQDLFQVILSCNERINIEDIDNTKYLYDNQFAGDIILEDNSKFYIYKKYIDTKISDGLVLESIPQKFDVEYINKGKSK